MACVSQLRGERLRSSVSKLSVVTEADIASYFGSQLCVAYLFPHERILVNGIPYRMMNSNIPLIMGNRKFTEMYTDVAIQNKTCSGLLSIGTVYPVKIPNYAYNIEIYGGDYSSLEDHICRHLRRVMDKAAGNVSIYVFVDPDKSLPKPIDEIMAKYGVKKYPTKVSKTGEELVMKRVLFEDTIPVTSRY